MQKPDWQNLAIAFHFISAQDLLGMQKMERHQTIRDKVRWLKDGKPLELIFVSHRWETLQHPDPNGRQLRALQSFLMLVCQCIEAMFVDRDKRLQLVPSLMKEGVLQAEEVARRVLGFGPFSDKDVCIEGGTARKMIKDKFVELRGRDAAFQDWLLNNIGVWLDYCCMPQKPLTGKENDEFIHALGAMDALVKSSTLVALRKTDDDYAMRGWCASEFFISSDQSFSRSLFINIDRLETDSDVAINATPTHNQSGSVDAGNIMIDSFSQDLAAFQHECERWSSMDGLLIEITPPNAWSEYRSLQGSSFYTPEIDPTPARPVLEAIRNMETLLIDRWLMSAEAYTLDISTEIEHYLTEQGLRCAEKQDLAYLGILLACHGWIDAFKPLFREYLNRYLLEKNSWNNLESIPSIKVILKPLQEEVRALFAQVRPSSAATWNFRLSTKIGHSANEKAVIDEIKAALETAPPEFEFL